MTITPERMVNLYFTQPYYTYPAAFFVHADNTTFTEPADLSGATIGVCGGPPLPDGGVAPPSDSGTNPPPTCALYGQTCNVSTDCCSGVPCTAGRCRYP